MACVLDVSVSLAWYLPGQGDPYATEIYRRLNAGELRASAPVLWRTELASLLLKACRRHSIRGPRPSNHALQRLGVERT